MEERKQMLRLGEFCCYTNRGARSEYPRALAQKNSRCCLRPFQTNNMFPMNINKALDLGKPWRSLAGGNCQML